MNTPSKGGKKIPLPSLKSLRNRIQGFSWKDLARQRELLLFAATLLVILFSVYTLVVKPERQRIVRAEATRQQLLEEVQALTAGDVDDRLKEMHRRINQLENEVRSAEEAWEATRRQVAPGGMSRGTVLREITLTPHASGWKVVGLEELDNHEFGTDPMPGPSHYKMTGEGTFAGLFRYLKRLENNGVPVVLTEMDMAPSVEYKPTLHGTLVLRIAGLREEQDHGRKEGGHP